MIVSASVRGHLPLTGSPVFQGCSLQPFSTLYYVDESASRSASSLHHIPLISRATARPRASTLQAGHEHHGRERPPNTELRGRHRRVREREGSSFYLSNGSDALYPRRFTCSRLESFMARCNASVISKPPTILRSPCLNITSNAVIDFDLRSFIIFPSSCAAPLVSATSGPLRQLRRGEFDGVSYRRRPMTSLACGY